MKVKEFVEMAVGMYYIVLMMGFFGACLVAEFIFGRFL